MLDGYIIIKPFDERNLKTSSYDVTLGPHYYVEKMAYSPINFHNPFDEKKVREMWRYRRAKPLGETALRFNGISDDEEVILLGPGERILAHTLEFIGGMSKITTKMQARSSVGRNGISVCQCAGQGDVGYFNRWTMEISNHLERHTVPLVVGRRYAQISFFEGEEIHPKDDYARDAGKYQRGLTVEQLEESWSHEMMLPRQWEDRESIAANEKNRSST